MKTSSVSLSSYLPASAADMVMAMIQHSSVLIRVVPPRKTLLGSFKPAVGARKHVITVNADLNPYQFLVVLLHEWAHYVQWQQCKEKGHGAGWKTCYAHLLLQYVNSAEFPHDLCEAIVRYTGHIKSTECADMDLCRLFQKYDNMIQKQQSLFFLADIPEKTVFLHNEIPMQKQKTLRKYIVCKNLNNSRLYRCHPSMKVELI